MERFDTAAAELFRAMRKIPQPTSGHWAIRTATVSALVFVTGIIAGHVLWHRDTAMSWKHRAVLEELEQDIARGRHLPIIDVQADLQRAVNLPYGAEFTDGYFDAAINHLAGQIPKRSGL